MATRRLKKILSSKRKKEGPIPRDAWLSSGSTLLNLQTSGKTFGCYAKGRPVLFVGDSDSGKSVFKMAMFGEAMLDPNFDEYLFIHDNPEDSPTPAFFGEKLVSRLQTPPLGTSEWIEDLYYNLDELYKEGKPFIYALDSMDTLDCRADADKFQKQKSDRAKGKETAGSMGMERAKINSSGLRKAQTMLRKTGSILFIIAQTRDAVGMFGYGPKKTWAGGNAPKFYSRLVIMSSAGMPIKKKVGNKERQIGTNVNLKVTKNHLTGRKGKVTVPIYNTVGLDDLGSCVDYLIEEGVWSKTKGIINAKDLDFKGKLDDLVEHIEENELEKELRKLVGQRFREIEKGCEVKRKGRYE